MQTWDGADTYPCNKVAMLSHLTLDDLGLSIVTDIWGWIDPVTKSDYAIVGSESDDHGVQVFDLTRLRGANGDRSPGADRRPPHRRRAPVEFDHDARYTGFSASHNLAINEDTGFLYVLGPDTDYRGREICFNSAADNNSEPGPLANTVSIVDVTDKPNPTSISRIPYENAEYGHQGWLTPDQAYFLHNDEGDEFAGVVDSTTTRIWDVTDLDAPVLVAAVGHGTPSTDHNLYTEGRYVYESNYNAGLRIFDTRELADGIMDEVAYFDVHPENDGEDRAPVSGTWSNYPYFRQNKIVAVASMDRGLFILRPQLGGV